MGIRDSVVVRFVVFVAERFPPAAYLPLIALFTAAGYVPAAVTQGRPLDPVRYGIAAVAVATALLHMRIEDDLKDAEVDRVARPWRPLPRGLVTPRELEVAGAGTMLAAVALAAVLGPVALAGFLPAAGYVALADLEFLGRTRSHPDLVAYALVHSPIVPLLLAFAWFAGPGAAPDAALAALVLIGWGTGLGMELARKTYARDEERPFVETYSAALGRTRALGLGAVAMGVGLVGVALYAVVAGAGVGLAVAALTAGGIVVVATRLLRDRGHRATELVGTSMGAAILLCPIGIALATRAAA